MRRSYRFSVSGHGVEGATFEASGSGLCEFHEAWDMAMRESFHQLTHGKAVYGAPGVGCRGPYTVKRVLIEEQPQ